MPGRGHALRRINMIYFAQGAKHGAHACTSGVAHAFPKSPRQPSGVKHTIAAAQGAQGSAGGSSELEEGAGHGVKQGAHA